MIKINFQKFPNFLIVGANKAGTTSIHYYCSQHPQICMSAIKEPMFFTAPKQNNQNKNNKNPLSNPKFVTSVEEYQNLFTGKKNSLCRGEASTAYLANPDTAISRIKAVAPEMKIIACLRHPIDRALSCYYMYLSEGLETRSFKQCVIDEIEGKVEKIPQGRRYLTLGLYYQAIKKYLEAFGDKQVLILFYDQLLQEPEIFMKKIFTFLGVDDSFIPNLEKKLNTSQERKQKNKVSNPKIEQVVYEMCVDFFKDDVQKLSEIIDFEVVSWKDLN